MCKYKTLGYTGLFSLHIERPSYFQNTVFHLRGYVVVEVVVVVVVVVVVEVGLEVGVEVVVVVVVW